MTQTHNLYDTKDDDVWWTIRGRLKERLGTGTEFSLSRSEDGSSLTAKLTLEGMSVETNLIVGTNRTLNLAEVNWITNFISDKYHMRLGTYSPKEDDPTEGMELI